MHDYTIKGVGLEADMTASHAGVALGRFMKFRNVQERVRGSRSFSVTVVDHGVHQRQQCTRACSVGGHRYLGSGESEPECKAQCVKLENHQATHRCAEHKG